MNKFITSISFSMFIFLSSSLPAYAVTYYVSNNGSGSNCSSTSPCSADTALGKLLVSGDVVYFRSGTYLRSASPISISSSGIKVLSDTTNGPVIITGDTNNDKIGEFPSHSSYIGLIDISGSNNEFRGFEVAYSGDRGIRVMGSNNLIIDNNIHHSWSSGIHVQGKSGQQAKNNTIQNNTVWRNADSNYCPNDINGYRQCNGNWPGGIGWGYVRNPTPPGSAPYTKIIGNTVFNNSGEGVICMHTDYATVEGNTVYDNWSQGIDLDQCNYTLIKGNLAYYTNDTRWWRATTPTGTAAPKVNIIITNEGITDDNTPTGRMYPVGHDRTVVNNILIGGGVNISFWNTMDHARLINDLFANNVSVEARGTGISMSAPYTSGDVHENTQVINNIMYESSGTTARAPIMTGLIFRNNIWNTAPDLSCTSTTCISNLLVNPLLKNPIAITKGTVVDPTWYQITSGSPAINKGISLTSSAFSGYYSVSSALTDYWKKSYSNPPDIGAFEYQGSPSLSPTKPDTPTLPVTNPDMNTYKDRVTFVGDSLTVGYAYYGTETPPFASTAKTSSAMLTDFGSVTGQLPKRKIVLILGGTNDGTWSTSTIDATMTNLKNMTDQATQAGIIPLVGTLPPLGAWADQRLAGSTNPNPADWKAGIITINSRIRTAYPNNYVDFNYVLKDPNNPDYFDPTAGSTDGLHPGSEGYRRMRVEAKTKLDQILGNLTPTPIFKPGDANNDSKVDGLDFSVWLTHYKPDIAQSGSYTIADFNKDNIVDGIDYSIWLSHYGM